MLSTALCVRHAYRAFPCASSRHCTAVGRYPVEGLLQAPPTAAFHGPAAAAGLNHLGLPTGTALRVARLHAPASLNIGQKDALRCPSASRHPEAPLDHTSTPVRPGQTFVKGLLLDVAGTLLSPSEPITDVYRRFATGHDLKLSDNEMLVRFRAAYNKPWTRSSLRYVGDARDFWRFMVSETTGCDDEDYFERVYEYYERSEAWTMAPGAEECLQTVREKGVKTAIVSNFDMRLPLILDRMGITEMVDEVVVSAEVQAEKPNPVIFQRAVELLELLPEECVHVGDDRRNDLWGARDAGCHALLWGSDVKDMKQVVEWVEHGYIKED